MSWKVVDAVFGLISDRKINRVLLYGPPGTGKSTLGQRRTRAPHYAVTLTDDSTVAEIIGHYIPRGQEFVFQHGPGIDAWNYGGTLILNEIDKASGPVETACHALLDDPEVARLTLPSGASVTPKEGFTCIATMNGEPASLEPALLDRFEARLCISSPCDEAVRALSNAGLQEMCKRSYSNSTPIVTYREIVAFGKLVAVCDKSMAATAVWGDSKGQEIVNLLSLYTVPELIEGPVQ